MINTNDTRALNVLDARRRGLTLKQIAEQYGFTRERARQLSMRGLQIEHSHSRATPSSAMGASRRPTAWWSAIEQSKT